MIVVDSSAVIAILFGEPEADAVLRCLAGDGERVISAASYVETGTVLAGRRKSDRRRTPDDLNLLLDQAAIVIVPVDAGQARAALRARIRYGKGMGHGGVLNFGDCFAYALARLNNAPLLFIGRDFATTDIEAALPATGAP